MTGVQTCALPIYRERRREFFVPSSEVEHRCKHLEKEKSKGINTIRLHICHHQIVGTGFGLDLGIKYSFLLSFFVSGFSGFWVLIPLSSAHAYKAEWGGRILQCGTKESCIRPKAKKYVQSTHNYNIIRALHG